MLRKLRHRDTTLPCSEHNRQCNAMPLSYQTAGVFRSVFTILYRAFRTLQAALQATTVVVNSHGLASSGSVGGTL